MLESNAFAVQFSRFFVNNGPGRENARKNNLPPSAEGGKGASHAQKRCLPICTISGRDQIHWLVAVTGLK